MHKCKKVETRHVLAYGLMILSLISCGTPRPAPTAAATHLATRTTLITLPATATRTPVLSTPTATLPPLTVTLRPTATPITAYQIVSYRQDNCLVKLKIPLALKTLQTTEGRLDIYDPLNEVTPSFFWTVSCYQFRNIEAALIETEAHRKLREEGYKSLSLDEFFVTNQGYGGIYFILAWEPFRYGATVLDRVWMFDIGNAPSALKPSTLIVDMRFFTDAYVDSNLIFDAAKSIEIISEP